MTQQAFDLEEYLKRLEILVNTDSGSEDPEGIQKIADSFSELYKNLGWTVEEHRFDPDHGVCLEIKNTTEDQFDLLLVGHMDTVFPKGTAKKRPFSINGDRAYGPGVVDMKASLLSLYYALRTITAEQTGKQPAICVALNSDEEISSIISCDWLTELAKKSRYALVIEPARANGALVSQRKGIARYDLEFNGIAAHAGIEPEKGSSAINELAHWVTELHSMTNFELGTTVNVGKISGGSGVNVVAEYAEAGMEIRVKDVEELQKVKLLIDDLHQNPRTKKVRTNPILRAYRPPMNPTEQTEKLMDLIRKKGENLGIQIDYVATGGGSDANLTAGVGVPSIDGLGPIGGGQHGDQEYLEINSIKPRLELLTQVIADIKSIC
ncbi:MAG: carboxypeptidase [SAR324 cluster bacterium]|uniref:Carboxypeptidase n=1 Tax=SAR324 cluster bacterium TaxID=2024889 RepID=A0A2A4SQZ5_9DELT|nr:MAG: carboxypeptidase [SAR324 cluster bacterium]